MLNTTINILTTIASNITVVTPASSNSIGNVYIGLIEERHYVGLDPIPVSSGEKLDDATVEEGDEHARLITGGPQVCSVLALENPETHLFSSTS